MFPSIRIVACVAAASLIAAAAYIWQLSLNDAHSLPSYIALGLVCLALGVAVAAWGAWAVRSRLRSPAARTLAALGVMVVGVAVTSGALLGWAYSVPEGRYARSYGGADQCLAGTAYASSHVSITVEHEDVLTAAPEQSSDAQPKLHFSHASKGTLSPADKATRNVLDEHGC